MIRLDKVLFVPSVLKGNGTGHLKRTIQWSLQFPSRNFYLPRGEKYFLDSHIDELLENCPGAVRITENPGDDWDLVILDNRRTSLDYLPEDLKKLPLIAVDETGPINTIAPYTVNILPGLENQFSNLTGLMFMDLPRPDSENLRMGMGLKILVSFGGEDPKCLSEKLLEGLKKSNSSEIEWTFIEGPFFHTSLQQYEPLSGITILKDQSDLKPLLPAFDLIITSFGLTAFEGIFTGRPVLLVNPSLYHDQLSGNAGFPFLSGSWKDQPQTLLKKINRVLEHKDLFLSWRGLYDRYNAESIDFYDWALTLTPMVNVCPVCASVNNPVIARYRHKSYFHCENRNCRIDYMLNFQRKSDIYQASYFFEDYKKQYGKTYLEDFEHIKSSGTKRLKRIQALNGQARTVLDVGCAFGPFLQAAKEAGLDSYGIDVAEEGVRYITEHLEGISASTVSLETLDPLSHFGVEQFDTVTLWYVIEHFSDTGQVLKKISELLHPGGVLAFSTPNGKGVSGLLNRKDFLLKSPDDHFTVWNRKSAANILLRYGFDQIKFHVTGYHPERIPIKLPLRKLLNKTVLLWICKIFSLGDTFEIYCRKKDRNE